MRLSIFLIIVLMVSGCEKKSNRFGYDPKWDLATEIYNKEIGEKVFSQLKTEKKLNVIESGASFRGREKFHCMHCGFQYFNEITLEEARKYLLETANLYLKTINENEKIRPFLEEYPFGLENIEIRIFINNLGDQKRNPEKLGVISMVDGILEYMIDNSNLTTICEETYQEALSKLGSLSISE